MRVFLRRGEVAATLFLISSLSIAQDELIYAEDNFRLDDIASESSMFWEDLNVTGYLKNETAYRLKEPRSITKIRNIVYLNSVPSLSDNLDLNVTAWAYYDHAYDFFNYETIAARFERNSDEPIAFIENLEQERDSEVVQLREFYIDYAADDYDLRVGKQYVIWGVLEGVRVVDEINPMDFRELILPDLLDYRISLWTIKLDYYTDYGDIQLLMIPDIKPHKPAPSGSEWELLQKVPNTVAPESWKIETAEYGVKFDTSLFETELSFSYFYTWDDYPVVFRTVKIAASSIEAPVFFPTYTRMSIFGMTAVRQLDDFIIKMELAYVEDKFFGLSNTADENEDEYVDTNGEIQKNHVRWGLGLDTVILGWDVGVGAMQWLILEHNKNMIQDKVDTSYSAFVRREFPKYSLTLQALGIVMAELGETYFKPKAFIQITDNVQVAFGLDLFQGEKSDFGLSTVNGQGQFNVSVQRAQFLGNFSKNDRAFFEVKYSF